MQGLHMGPGLDLPTMVDVMLCTRNMTNDLGVIPLLKGVQELGREVLSVGWRRSLLKVCRVVAKSETGAYVDGGTGAQRVELVPCEMAAATCNVLLWQMEQQKAPKLVYYSKTL